MASASPTSLRPYRAGLAFSFSNAVNWIIALSTPMVLFAEQLGASPFEVGLAYAAVYLALPLQIVATAAIPHLGYKRQAIIGWAARNLGIVVPLGLAALAPAAPERWMVGAMVGGVYAFCILRAFGAASMQPWLYAWIPAKLRGRYFATDQVVGSVGGILVLVGVAALFAALDDWSAFFWAYVIALVGSIASVYNLARWPDVPRPPRMSLARVFRRAGELVSQPSGFRRYLALVVGWWLVTGGIAPFTAYFLKAEAGMSSDKIIFFSTFQYVGTVLGAVFVRSRIDRFGARPFFVSAMFTHALVGVFWLAALTVAPFLTEWAALGYFLLGIAGSQWFSPHLKYLPQVCDEDERALAVSVHTAIVGIAAGLGPMIWGLFIKQSGAEPGMQVDRFALYFSILIVAQLALAIPFSKLVETDPSSPMLLTNASRLPRVMASLINLIPTGFAAGERGRSQARSPRR